MGYADGGHRWVEGIEGGGEQVDKRVVEKCSGRKTRRGGAAEHGGGEEGGDLAKEYCDCTAKAARIRSLEERRYEDEGSLTRA